MKLQDYSQILSNLFVLTLVFSLSFGCSDDEVTRTPDTPVFVSKNSDTSKYDTGIRPISGSNGIYLEWYETNDSDVDGYILYRTTDYIIQGTGEQKPVNFNQIVKIPLGSQEPDTTFEDINIDNGERYYYRLTTYSNSGGESSPSEESPNFVIKNSPILESPTGQFDIPKDKTLTFKWTHDGGGSYIVKVYTQDPYSGETTIVARCYIEQSGFAGADSVTIDFNSPGTFGESGREINVYKTLEGDFYGVPYSWYVIYAEPAIDQLTGSISESAFSLTN